MMILRKTLCVTLAGAIIISSAAVCGVGNEAAAAAKATLKNKKADMKVGEKVTIKIKNKKKKGKYTYTSSKKAVATVSKKGVITAKKKGSANITVKEKYNKKTRSLGKVKVTVSAKGAAVSTASADVSATSAQTPAASTTAPTPTPVASATPAAEPTKTPESDFLPIKQFLDDEEFTIPDPDFDKVIAANAGTLERIEYPSTVITEGTVMRKANVALPKDYDDSKKYPVIYIAHGIGGNQDSMIGDGDVKTVLWNAIANGVAEEAILVFVSGCANEYNGQGPYGFFSVEHYRGYNNFLNDFEQCLKPYIDENYSTLPDRENTAICGFSMGGRVTLHLGFALQDTFRYVGAFCPAPGILDFTDQNVTDKGLFTPETFTLQDKYMNDTLVMIIKGVNDGTVHKFPKEYHEALEANDVPHIYLETMGGTDGTNGDGQHGGSVYKYGFYNFLKRIFKKK